MKKITLKIILICFVLIASVKNTYSYTIVKEVATHADGYDIPIIIYLPDDISKKHPVQFHVHGGGWNGGNAKSVPKASVKSDAQLLCDRLGIIYVGLAYRCKGNKGTFALAIEDLKASIKWFMDKADFYNADLTRIAFSGGSAGTTLSSILAQNYPNCKAYIGTEGMYNLVVKDNSSFPKEEARKDYDIDTPEKARAASAFYNLATPTPPALLFHGLNDFLCDYTQSINYANAIIKAGGEAKVITYENINHTCLSPTYPKVFKNTVLEIAKFLVEKFELSDVDMDAITLAAEKLTYRHEPCDPVPVEKIIGTWKSKAGSVSFKKNNTCTITEGKKKTILEGRYKIDGSKIAVVYGDKKKEKEFFYSNGNAVKEVMLEKNVKNTKKISRIYSYKKMKK